MQPQRERLHTQNLCYLYQDLVRVRQAIMSPCIVWDLTPKMAKGVYDVQNLQPKARLQMDQVCRYNLPFFRLCEFLGGLKSDWS